MIDLRKLSFEWESDKVVHKLHDGWTIRRVQSPADYVLETYFLGHCLGTKNFRRFEIGHRAFSLRDRYNIPHATILCIKPDIVSPYMSCNDMGSMEHINVDGELLRVLQVRGRMDKPASFRYFNMVRHWWEERAMRELDDKLKKRQAFHAAIFGDKDREYHEFYRLDEEENPYKDAEQDSDSDEAGVQRGWLSW